jgi:hypothetical protein
MRSDELSRFPGLNSRIRRSRRRNRLQLPWYASLRVTPMIMPRNRKFPDPEVRAGLVARVRREIEAGTYDTPEKLEIALQRMFDCLADDGERDERET